MKKQGKLELTWVGKYDEKKVEPRILVEDKSKSYGDPNTENMLIHGDNLIALKALEQDFAGKIKCVYIDPPYNTGSAFEHYEDGLEHSEWLCMMKPRMEILYNLLSDDGSIWITLDDNEAFRFKLLADEIFGEGNFVATIIWNSRKSKQNDTLISLSHNYIFVYAKDKTKVVINKMSVDSEKFSNPDNDPRGPWVADPFDAPQIRANLSYPIENPNTKVIYYPPQGRHWRTTQQEYLKLLSDNKIVFGKNGNAKPQQKRFLSEAKGITIGTLWDDVGTATEATKEIQKLFNKEQSFDTPKPERLIERIISLATEENDIVLDSFLGSGTTVAVAHKMKRKWIGIELGEHCYTHVIPRINAVINGEQGGISKSVGWEGGGGYKFYELAEPLLIKNPIIPIYQINPVYTFDMMAEAICKLEGFKYTPVGEYHGISSENRFIHVTNQFVNSSYVISITKNLDKHQSLLIYCTKKQSKMILPDNIEIKKIPKDLLEKCSFESEGM